MERCQMLVKLRSKILDEEFNIETDPKKDWGPDKAPLFYEYEIDAMKAMDLDKDTLRAIFECKKKFHRSLMVVDGKIPLPPRPRFKKKKSSENVKINMGNNSAMSKLQEMVAKNKITLKEKKDEAKS